MLLFFVRLVGKSKDSVTERFAFDKPQLRLRRPVCEEASSLSHDNGLDEEPYSSIRSVPISDWKGEHCHFMLLSFTGFA
jgi:hypothetical protein